MNLYNSAIARLASRSRYIQAFRDRAFLLLHRGRSFAQHEEDVYVLDDIFAGKNNGFYVDIGASHPLRISNTYLLYKSGWRGIIVEPIPRLIALHRAWRPRDIQVRALVGDNDRYAPFYELYPSVFSTADPKTVHTRLQQRPFRLIQTTQIRMYKFSTLIQEFLPHGTSIDFVSIDVEGSDLSVVSEMLKQQNFLPKCVCVEANDADAIRCTSQKMAERYDLRRRTDFNLIFCLKEN